MRYLAIPKVQLALILIVIILANLFFGFSPHLLLYFGLTISLAVFVDYLLVRARKIKPFFFSAAAVSGSIIALLNSPGRSGLEVFMIVVLAIASKHFLKLNGRHIFNPAAFGLFFGSLLFKNPVAWWGIASNQWLMLILLFLTGYVSIFRSRKGFLILSFFIVYNLLVFFFNSYINLLDPVVIFFALVMLPEPMTTPNRPNRQIVFGIVAAALTMILSRIGFISDILLGPLLLSNLLFLAII
jgi:Na+-translocating ferredoxin:NAD+ oxidoreductase RnfD subunit